MFHEKKSITETTVIPREHRSFSIVERWERNITSDKVAMILATAVLAEGHRFDNNELTGQRGPVW